MELAVAELLEQEEKKALEKRAKSKQESSPDPTGNRDPRRNGHDGRARRDKHHDDADRHDERRSHNRRSRDGTGGGQEGDDIIALSDHESANGSVHSRRRSRSPVPGRREHRDRDHHARDADRNRNYRDRHDRRDRRDRDRDDRDRGDYYRGGRRSSGGADERDRYYRPNGGRPHRDDDRPPTRDRYDDRNRHHGRDRRRSPGAGSVRKPKTPEPTDDERDRRTVFVQQLAARLHSSQLIKFFEQLGPVNEAQIVKDRVSHRSKGVGYVEFKDEESVEKAMQLTGQKLLGIPIIVQVTEAEKNRQARVAEGVATQSNGIPFHRLYVGNIHFSITEDDLKSVFESFGQLEFVQLQKEENGRSKGYGFVQFADPGEAKDALEKMNGFELAGRPIRVGLGNDKFTTETTQNLLQRFGSQQQQSNTQGSQFSGMGGRSQQAGGTNSFDRAGGRDAEKTGGASALDDTDVGGVNFSNYSRDALMRKLARTDEPEQKLVPQAQQKKAPEAPVAATRCVLLKNMWSENDTSARGWQKELEDDVREECVEKYGVVMHVGIDPSSHFGEIYVKFDRVQGGENAYRGLNGRFFGGGQITAQYVVDAVYNMIFPKAAGM